MAGFDDGAAERDREMRFPHAGRAENQHIFGLREKAAGGELTNEPLIDRWLEFKVKVVERLHRREVGDLEAHRGARALFRVNILAEHAVEKVEIRRLGPGRIIEYGVETLSDVAQTEPTELLDDPSMDDDAHWPPPEMMAAYS